MDNFIKKNNKTYSSRYLKTVNFSSIILILLLSVFAQDVKACYLNKFFRLDIPQGWTEYKCAGGICLVTNQKSVWVVYAPDTEKYREYAFAKVIQGEQDLRNLIKGHVKDFDEKSFPLFEDLCYHKQEQFHGYNALSYTFAGRTEQGLNIRGKIYAFHAGGYTFLFVYKFYPLKGYLSTNTDVWSSIEWYPKNQWKLPNF